MTQPLGLARPPWCARHPRLRRGARAMVITKQKLSFVAEMMQSSRSISCVARRKGFAGRAVPAAGARYPGETGHSAATFYRWYDRHRSGGPEALSDRSPRMDRVWNRIPGTVRENVIQLALDEPALSPRELAVRFSDTKDYFVSAASVSATTWLCGIYGAIPVTAKRCRPICTGDLRQGCRSAIMERG